MVIGNQVINNKILLVFIFQAELTVYIKGFVL